LARIPNAARFDTKSTLTRRNETVATSETSETVYFRGAKTVKIQAVAEDFSARDGD